MKPSLTFKKKSSCGEKTVEVDANRVSIARKITPCKLNTDDFKLFGKLSMASNPKKQEFNVTDELNFAFPRINDDLSMWGYFKLDGNCKAKKFNVTFQPLFMYQNLFFLSGTFKSDYKFKNGFSGAVTLGVKHDSNFAFGQLDFAKKAAEEGKAANAVAFKSATLGFKTDELDHVKTIAGKAVFDLTKKASFPETVVTSLAVEKEICGDSSLKLNLEVADKVDGTISFNTKINDHLSLTATEQFAPFEALMHLVGKSKKSSPYTFGISLDYEF